MSFNNFGPFKHRDAIVIGKLGSTAPHVSEEPAILPVARDQDDALPSVIRDALAAQGIEVEQPETESLDQEGDMAPADLSNGFDDEAEGEELLLENPVEPFAPSAEAAVPADVAPEMHADRCEPEMSRDGWAATHGTEGLVPNLGKVAELTRAFNAAEYAGDPLEAIVGDGDERFVMDVEGPESRLIAEGFANPAATRSLMLSTPTVESHAIARDAFHTWIEDRLDQRLHSAEGHISAEDLTVRIRRGEIELMNDENDGSRLVIKRSISKLDEIISCCEVDRERLQIELDAVRAQLAPLVQREREIGRQLTGLVRKRNDANVLKQKETN